MRILLTNDDGIHAPGIVALHRELTAAGYEVQTIAPLTAQSATSHGITFNDPLMIHDIVVNEHMRGIAVDGRPADCTKLAITSLWEERFGGKPDLVVSGMNAGTNVGIHIIYSGTVGAAIEGAFLGIPAIAVSLHIRDWNRIRWDIAARHAGHAIGACLAHPDEALKPHGILNINIPAVESEAVLSHTDTSDLSSDELDAQFPLPEMRVVPMNLAAVRDQYDRRVSPGGDVYYWITGDGLDFHDRAEGSDVEALFDQYITMTPLQYDLTAHSKLGFWREKLT